MANFGPKLERRNILALTGLEARIGLIDDVNAALAAHELVVAMTPAQGFQRIADFHSEEPNFSKPTTLTKY